MKVGNIGEYIRQQREQAKISLRQLATAAGISNPYLSQIERGLRRPSAEILQQIAKGLRISAEALYVQAGILEDRVPDSGVRAAVLADPGLAERQKQVLLEIYESFRRETAGPPAAESMTDPDATAGDATGTAPVPGMGDGAAGRPAADVEPGPAADVEPGWTGPTAPTEPDSSGADDVPGTRSGWTDATVTPGLTGTNGSATSGAPPMDGGDAEG
jgi:transcriptional regulator with XRE-family HTH domain